ncbi:allantoin permease [Pseudomonas sp. PA15(2017)]|uniref:purine-cytosine permease family protein n=1 Tax=Pseudomonas sp. PA15(2017) TaxID=1932111 RepID=UPI0009682E9D|nr:cytosine permease [Pseudomonas sp. PA15(2017)]OLU35207.1 allantoin permease [Pseudomonas sp. PA15(2017)]
MRASEQVGQLETRGIEPVPEQECNGHPLQLFWVWFAANISILGLPLGATLIAFQGLSIWQALVVAILGAGGSFAIVGLLSIAGRRGRAPSLTLSRAIFGMRGNIGPTLVSLGSRLGWETVNTTTAAFVLLSLVSIVQGTPVEAKSAPLLTLLFIGLFVLLTLCVSGLGHATLLVIQKWATWVFGALNLVVGGFLALHIDWALVWAATPAPMSAVLIGIGTMAAGTGIGWANAGADMSRYQHKSVRAAGLVASAAFGAGIPLVLLITLGGLISVGNDHLASATDPIVAIRELLPTWMAVPYLITAFGGLLLSNNLSVYSAGLTTLTLGLKVKRVYAVVVDIVAIFIGSIYFMLIAESFYGPFITFISMLAVPITAWVGIFLVDLRHRQRYEAADLMNVSPSSAYWYAGGVEWRALSAWAVAIALGFSFTTVKIGAGNVLFQGWLADSWFGQNGLGWIVTFVVAGGLYALLGGCRDRRAAVTHEAAHGR